MNSRTIAKLTLVPKFPAPVRNDPTDPYNRVGKNFANVGIMRASLPKTNIIASLKKLAIIRKNMV